MTRPFLARAWPWLCFVAILYTAFITFHLNLQIAEPGLDPSWAWALNYAHAETDFRFGQDLVFTYGPLGFLARPQAYGSNLELAAVFSIALAVLLALVMGVFAAQAERRLNFALFLLVFALASVFGLWEEYYYLSVLGLCLLAGVVLEGPLTRLLLFIGGILAAHFLLLKFNLGLSSTAMVVVSSACLLWYKPLDFRRRLAALLIPYAVTLAVLVAIFFRGPVNFVRWLLFSFEVGSGYGTAMSQQDGPWWQPVAGVLFLFCILAGAIFARGRWRIPLLLFAGPAVLACKHAFVGYNLMATGYFLFLMAIAAAILLRVETRRQLLFAGVFFLAVTSVAFWRGVYGAGNPPITRLGSSESIRGVKVRQTFQSLLHLSGTKEELRARSRGALAEQRLPERWRQTLAASGGVDVLPWELSYIPANGLPWRPNLLVQSYSAYTRRLDHAIAENLRNSSRAPGALLVELVSLGARHIMLDTPENFQAIQAHYEVLEVDHRRSLLLLRRRQQAEPQHLAPISSGTVSFNQWTDVPSAPGRIYARMQFRTTILGALRRLFWQIPAVYLRLEYASGRKAEFRMLPETAANGVLLNYLPVTLEDLYDILQNSAYDQVKRFEISGPGAAAYRDSIAVEWLADQAPVRNFSTSREQAPRLVDWAPGEQSRQARQLTITAGDANGYRDVEFIQLIVNSAQDGHNACYLSYEPRNQRLLLYDDSSNGIAGASPIGAPEVLENSKCAVNLAESWVRSSGEQITLSIAAALRPAVKSTQKIFATVIDREKQSVAWRQVADWPATAGGAADSPWQFPETAPVLRLAEASPMGPDAFRLRLQARDLNGAKNIDRAQVIINDSGSGQGGCYFDLMFTPRLVSLFQPDGANVASARTLGAAEPLQTSLCRVSVANSTLAEDGRTLTFTVDVTLLEGMAGKRKVFGFALDRNGLQMNWKEMGALR